MSSDLNIGRHKRRLRRYLLSLITGLLLLLTGCSEAADTSGLAGSYVLTYASGSNSVLSETQVREKTIVLRLEENGRGEIRGGELSGRIHWGLEGGALVIDAGAIRLKGYAENGAILLKENGSGATLRFEPETTAETVDDIVNTETEALYLGDWYGWWKIESETGNMPRSWYDCCARIDRMDEGSLHFVLWDEDGSAAEPLAEIRMAVRGDGIESLDGYFLFSDIRAGEWRLEKPEPALYLAEGHHDAEGEQFSYSVYLRPWGEQWNDADGEQLPFYYSDWYVPAILSGESMPDRIPWQELEMKRENPGD